MKRSILVKEPHTFDFITRTTNHNHKLLMITLLIESKNETIQHTSKVKDDQKLKASQVKKECKKPMKIQGNRIA